MKQLGYLLTCLVLGLTIYSCEDSPSSGFTDDGEMLTLDVRVFLMESSESSNLTATLDEKEVEVLFTEVNAVWEQANIRWNLEEVIISKAMNAEEFERMMRGERPRSTSLLRSILPRDQIASETFNVFLIHNFGGGIGGIYFPDLGTVLQPEVDPSGKIGFDGGIIRILAHELGHSLSLPHVPCFASGNLMAPGCLQGDRTRLNPIQVESTRQQALRGVAYSGS